MSLQDSKQGLPAYGKSLRTHVLRPLAHQARGKLLISKPEQLQALAHWFQSARKTLNGLIS